MQTPRAPHITLARDAGEVSRLAASVERLPRVALDLEANGLFAYEASLCVLSIAWEEGSQEEGSRPITVAIVDPLATSIEPLRRALGPEGPVKILHDLSFDARLLERAGLPLGRARDTSLMAHMLGAAATGLGALLERELGVPIDKRLQQHDWARRPLTAEQIVYLAEDVSHLFALDDTLSARAEALDITAEIEDECAYRLASAKGPARDDRPTYARIKGATALDAPGRAALRRLEAARDAVARARDVPPFKVMSSEALLAVARARPVTTAALLALPEIRRTKLAPAPTSTNGQDLTSDVLLQAVAEGIGDGDVPADHAGFFAKAASPDRATITAKRDALARISAFRKGEAKRRGVDEQVILPGHCAHDLVDVLLAHRPDAPALPEAIAAIPGIGSRRLARYAGAFVALARAEDGGGSEHEPFGETKGPKRQDASELQRGSGYGRGRGREPSPGK